MMLLPEKGIKRGDTGWETKAPPTVLLPFALCTSFLSL
jgi:hypothetical protein